MTAGGGAISSQCSFSLCSHISDPTFLIGEYKHSDRSVIISHSLAQCEETLHRSSAGPVLQTLAVETRSITGNFIYSFLSLSLNTEMWT